MTFDMPGPAASWEQRGGWVVRALMRDLDLKDFQAAGFVGNPGYESKGFTALQEIRPVVRGSKGGAGWCQWTGYTYPNDRRLKFESWCAAQGISPASDEANYGFILEELRGRFKGFTAKLRQCTTIEEACRLTHAEYETPSDVLDGSYRSGPDRLRWAQRALAGAQAMLAADDTGTVDPVEPCAAAVDLDLLGDIVRAAQRVVGTKPDGRLGPITYAAIQAAQRSAA